MHCTHCKKSILNQVSSYFWSGAVFGALILAAAMYYFDLI